MLAREVYRSLLCALVAAKVGVLTDAPAGVAAEQVGIARRVAQRCPAGVVRADAGENALQLLQAALRISLDVLGVGGIWRCRREGRPSVPARIIDKQAVRTCLTE